MGHFLQDVEITNFKSIRHQKIEGCRRINVFIGYPNVGKSNILEALALFSLPYLKAGGSGRKLTEFIRLENLRELFFEANVEEGFSIATNGGESSCRSQYDRQAAYPLACLYDSGLSEWLPTRLLFNDSFSARIEYRAAPAEAVGSFQAYFPVKKYQFDAREPRTSKRYFPFLLPAKGANLFSLLNEHPGLAGFVKEEIDRIGGEFIFDKSDNSGKVLKRTPAGDYTIPYTSLADTIQRLIFYKAAIDTNTDSVILLEEPEAHMFPPYIRVLGYDIISSSSNQFFIATHSPFVLDYLLEEAPDELAIYLVDYDEGETKVQLLAEEDVQEVREYGVDLFFNTESYLKRGYSHRA